MWNSSKSVVLAFAIVMLAIPLGTGAIVVAIAGMDVIWDISQPTARQRELASRRERFSDFHNPSRSDLALAVIERPNDIMEGRAASVEIVIDDRQLAGEDYSRKKAAATILGPLYAQQECQLLLQTFAARCQSGSLTVSGEQNAWKIRMTLQFTQKSAFGTIPDGEKQIELMPLRYEHGAAEKMIITDIGSASEKRRAIYDTIAKDCALARSTYGNCAIVTIKVVSQAIGSANRRQVITMGSAVATAVTGIRTRADSTPR